MALLMAQTLTRTNGEVDPIHLGPFTLTREGLTILGEPSQAEWQGVGVFCAHVQSASSWWLVDWLSYGESRVEWEDAIDQAISLTGLSISTLRHIRMARRVDPCRRRHDLDLSKHLEVSGLPPEQQTAWLNEAATEGWTTRELRHQIRASHQDALTPAEDGPESSILATLVPFMADGSLNSLHCLGPCPAAWDYVAWQPGQETITLDGAFTADHLEALAAWMRNH